MCRNLKINQDLGKKNRTFFSTLLLFMPQGADSYGFVLQNNVWSKFKATKLQMHTITREQLVI